MTKYISAILIGLLIATVWGYFADLQNGQVGWFIGRLIFVPLAIVAIWRAFVPKSAAGART